MWAYAGLHEHGCLLSTREYKTFHKLSGHGGDYVTFVCARINWSQCCATHHRIWWSMFWCTGRDIIVLKNLCLLFLLCADKIGMKHLSDIHRHTAFHRCLANIYANSRTKQTSWEYLKLLQADLSHENCEFTFEVNMESKSTLFYFS